MRVFESLVERLLEFPLFLQLLAPVLTEVDAVYVGQRHALFVPRPVLAGYMRRFEHIGWTDFTSFEALLMCSISIGR